jgi:exopolysaccharide biosynthesis protein
MKHTKTIQARKRVTTTGRVASRRRTFPRLLTRRAATIAGCVVLFLVALGAGAHDSFERILLEHALGGAFGGDASIARLRHAGGRTILEGVRVQSTSGSAVVTADRLAFAVSGETCDVQTSGLRAVVDVDRIAGDEFVGAPNAVHLLGARRLVVHVTNAGIVFTRSDDDAARLEVAGISGTLAPLEGAAYTLSAELITAAGAYPLAASAVNGANGEIDQHWTAPAVPLAPLVALLGDAGLAVTEGEARDVAFTSAGGLRGTLTLAGLRGTIAHRAVHDVAGPVTIVRDGLGTAGLDGVLDDGTPVAAVGEVHDGADWGRTLHDGTRDLRALGRMFALIATQSNLRWANVETTAPGVTFGQYAMTTQGVPHVVTLIGVDPHEPTVHFDTALSADHIISDGARTSDLGLRTKAVAGVNGDYFDIGRTYEPQGMLIRSGTLLHGPTDHEAVVFDRNNAPTFAVFHLRGTVVDGERRYPITLFNSWPTRDVTIITPDYGKTLRPAAGVTFVALESLGGTRYRVTALHRMTQPLPVSLGLGISDLLGEPLPRAGDVLDVSYAVDPPVTGAIAGIGSGPLLLKDGAWFEDRHAPAPDERNVQWPVVALGSMPDGTLMLAAVDGRHPERSIGMTRPEFAELLQGYGMRDAMALDSGGSVTVVSRAPGSDAITVRNVPSDFDAERYVSDALFLYSSAPRGTIVTSPRPHREPSVLGNR